ARGLLLLGALLLQRSTQDVSERSAGVGRAVLGDRLLLLGDLERLDRDGDLARLLVEGSDAGIHLLADGETLRTLLVAVARQVRALDEGVDVVVDQLHLDAAVLDTGDLAGDDRALAQFARGRRFADGVTTELLDAERDALLLDVHVENLRLHHVAAVVLLDRLLARTVPVQVGEVDHAVDIAVETYEQAELGLVLDLALDHGADRMVALEGFPRVLERLLEAERDAALDRVDLEHDHLDLLRGRQ